MSTIPLPQNDNFGDSANRYAPRPANDNATIPLGADPNRRPPMPHPAVPQQPDNQTRPRVTPEQPRYRQYPPNDYNPPVGDSNYQQSSSSNKIVTIGVIAGVLVLLGIAGFIFYLKSDNTPEIAAEPATQEISAPETVAMAEQPVAQAAEETPGVGAATEQLSLFNRPLSYAGTVTPGGAASLNIILYQNGRIEGSLDYSNGKSMPVYGSYTWTDNGHKMNVNLTVSSNSDATYSESWMGSSSYIKDDLAHTLTFNRINTSTGQSMSASFALKL